MQVNSREPMFNSDCCSDGSGTYCARCFQSFAFVMALDTIRKGLELLVPGIEGELGKASGMWTRELLVDINKYLDELGTRSDVLGGGNDGDNP